MRRLRDLVMGWFQGQWLVKGNYLVSATVFELEDGEVRYLVGFLTEQMKVVGINWIRYFRIPVSGDEVSQYIDKLQEKEIPVWSIKVTGQELDQYIRKLKQNFSWESTDCRSFRASKRPPINCFVR